MAKRKKTQDHTLKPKIDHHAPPPKKTPNKQTTTENVGELCSPRRLNSSFSTKLCYIITFYLVILNVTIEFIFITKR